MKRIISQNKLEGYRLRMILQCWRCFYDSQELKQDVVTVALGYKNNDLRARLSIMSADKDNNQTKIPVKEE